MSRVFPAWDDHAILTARPPKNPMDPWKPYGFWVEPECGADRRIHAVATILLTNRECPFRCLMCDLWRNTLDETVPPGAIPAQIDYALQNLPPATAVKLYNSGNFFDRKAIPVQEYRAIARRLERFHCVIVENHPRLCTSDLWRFHELIAGRLEVAMGLETAHPEVLQRLNKQMTVEDFQRAAEQLVLRGISVRAFILLKPPLLTHDDEALHWAVRSVQLAHHAGASCCTIIPTRAGNGIMDRLLQEGWFQPPSLALLEHALDQALALGSGRVFADLWDLQRLARCPACFPARRQRLREINLRQTPQPPVHCPQCSP